MSAPVMASEPQLRSARLDAYADRFADLFPRADQFRRFRAYRHGLLDDGPRKNVVAIASRSDSGLAGDSNLDQALQHFISQSPWDAGRVMARYREVVRPAVGGGAWVVRDAVILKKGRHSVGSQRQFARGLGRKVNSQVAVVGGAAGPAGYVPLGVRLFRPG